MGANTSGIFIAREDKMLQQVWKFPLGTGLRNEVDMPPDARIVEVAMQHGRFTLWAVVVPAAAMEKRVFYIVGTGQPVPADAHTHLGTVHDEPFVFHVFEGWQ